MGYWKKKWRCPQTTSNWILHRAKRKMVVDNNIPFAWIASYRRVAPMTRHDIRSDGLHVLIYGAWPLYIKSGKFFCLTYNPKTGCEGNDLNPWTPSRLGIFNHPAAWPCTLDSTATQPPATFSFLPGFGRWRLDAWCDPGWSGRRGTFAS